MIISVPCKNKEQMELVAQLFVGHPVIKRENKIEIKNGNLTIDIFVYDELVICGRRGDYVLISNQFDFEQIEKILLPMLAARRINDFAVMPQ